MGNVLRGQINQITNKKSQVCETRSDSVKRDFKNSGINKRKKGLQYPFQKAPQQARQQQDAPEHITLLHTAPLHTAHLQYMGRGARHQHDTSLLVQRGDWNLHLLYTHIRHDDLYWETHPGHTMSTSVLRLFSHEYKEADKFYNS